MLQGLVRRRPGLWASDDPSTDDTSTGCCYLSALDTEQERLAQSIRPVLCVQPCSRLGINGRCAGRRRLCPRPASLTASLLSTGRNSHARTLAYCDNCIPSHPSPSHPAWGRHRVDWASAAPGQTVLPKASNAEAIPASQSVSSRGEFTLPVCGCSVSVSVLMLMLMLMLTLNSKAADR